MCVQNHHNYSTRINYSFNERKLIACIREQSGVCSALLQPSGLFLCSRASRQQKKDTSIFWQCNWDLYLRIFCFWFIYMWDFLVCLFVYLQHPCSCSLWVRAYACQIFKKVLFLGIPNQDEEGGWIEAASISWAKGDPAVACGRTQMEPQLPNVWRCRHNLQ